MIQIQYYYQPLVYFQFYPTFQSIFLRYQLWPLDKKLRVVRQAKDYLNRHASEVEQRLAQDRTFKGRLQTAKLKFIKWLQVEKVKRNDPQNYITE